MAARDKPPICQRVGAVDELVAVSGLGPVLSEHAVIESGPVEGALFVEGLCGAADRGEIGEIHGQVLKARVRAAGGDRLERAGLR